MLSMLGQFIAQAYRSRGGLRMGTSFDSKLNKFGVLNGSAKEVVICYDGDNAGVFSATRNRAIHYCKKNSILTMSIGQYSTPEHRAGVH